MGIAFDARGFVTPLIAICLAVLLGFAGLAVDVAYWEYQQREQQSAADAAAVGGAQQLVYSNCSNADAAKAAAQSDASDDGYANGSNGVTVSPNNPPQSGPYAGDPCAVDVQVTRTGIASFFTRLFGLSSGVTETTEAVGRATPINPGCLYLLDQTAAFNLAGNVILAPSCAVYADSAIVNTLASVITVQSFGYAHALQENLLTLFLKAQPKPMLPVADPCPEIVSCAYIAANPPSAGGGCPNFVNVLGTVGPGCYNNFTSVLALTMQCGTYIFEGKVQITGILLQSNVGCPNGIPGITLYVTSTGSVSFFGNVELALTPPTTGPYAGVLYYQVPGNTNPVNLTVAATLFNLSGLFYAPSAPINILGQANVNFSNYMVFVCSNITFNIVNVDLQLNGPPNGLSYIKQAVLVQ